MNKKLCMLRKKDKKRLRKLITSGLTLALAIIMLSGCAANKDERELLNGVGASGNVEILTPEEQAKLEEEKESEFSEEERTSEEVLADDQARLEEEAEDAAKKEQIKKESQKTSKEVKAIAEEYKSAGEFAVYTYNLKTDIYGKYNSHKMQAASLIKVFIAGTVYENWDTLLEQGSEEEELDGLLKDMITVSDNSSANTLIRKLGCGITSNGMEAVNAYCKNHGYKDTHLGRMLLESNDQDDNYTSVKDCGKFLKEVYHNKLEGSEDILNLMKKQERTNKIPAGLPEEIETANKTGELADVENDIALVWGKEPYILCVMTENISGSGNVIDGIKEISSQVFDMWEK